MRRFLKTGLSWFVAVIGLLVGFIRLAQAGMWWSPVGDWESGWLLRWVGFIAVPVVALAFLTGSVVSLRSRKVGGIIFLAFMPVAAFLLAYPDSGFLVWYKEGGFFEVPEPLVAIGLTILFYAPFLVMLALRDDRRKAAFAFGLSVAVVALIFSRTRWWSVLPLRLFGWSMPFLLFGAFWFWTGRRGWPALVRYLPASFPKRVGGAILGALAIGVLDVLMTFSLTALGSSTWGPDCGRMPGPYTAPRFPGHMLFTAKTVFVGRSMRTALLSRNQERGSSDIGEWAVAVVDQPFWGVRSWRRLVLLTDGYYWKNRNYFIDGSSSGGLLDRHLPIIRTSPCGRSNLAENALVDLRVLHQPPPKTGARILGFVRELQPYSAMQSPPPTKPYAGIEVSLTSPDGSRNASTDSSGVYEFDGLPSGEYVLTVRPPSDFVALNNEKPVKLTVEGNAAIDHSFYLRLNGRIEGRVVDQWGKPAHAFVMVVDIARQSEPGRGMQDFLPTSGDGSFHVSRIPPGKYVVLINPSGPWDGSPFDIQYYPSNRYPQNAQVFTIGPGQQITGINFVATRLAEKTVQLHLTWPDGRPVYDASVCGAYEHTRDYDPLVDRNCYAHSDGKGNATVRFFGESRVRFFAEQQYKSDSDTQMYYSPRVEAEVQKLPDKIALVLKPPTSR